ncbi:FkbM family methyltransferase [Rhodospirillaceae bacterium SYSU D60014]|uniref:FkbM family methyltransferase n=1 Tax=Virgifigura deserti TaxID=2268457 RepID=UPI000E67154E
MTTGQGPAPDGIDGERAPEAMKAEEPDFRNVVLSHARKSLNPKDLGALQDLLASEQGAMLAEVLMQRRCLTDLLELNRRKNQWLLNYRRDVTSQSGEDGVIEKILELIPNQTEWCVEFGALNGELYSNTYNLIMNRGWSSIQIEGEPAYHKRLQQTHAGRENVHCLNQYVGLEAGSTLDEILAKFPIPKDFDLLSIDIDGCDYHVWRSLKNYRPKIIVIEFNPAIPPHITFVQAPDFRLREGSSLRAMWELGKELGYTLVCNTFANAIFVRTDYAAPFGVETDDPEPFFRSRELLLDLFQLFDGTLVVEGNRTLNWSKVPFGSRDLQVMPSLCRGPYWTRFPFIRKKWLQLFHPNRVRNRKRASKDY